MQRKPSIALVTYIGEPNLTEDDQLLKRAIEQLGGAATSVCWNDPATDWLAADLAVVRSTWDYIFDSSAFTRWIEDVSAQTKLVNDAQLLAWNVNKRYLFDLQAKGVRIVPSLLVEEGKGNHKDTFESALGQFQRRVVIKPTVSCGSHLTRHFSVTSLETYEDALAHLKLVLQHSEALIQPLLAEVFNKGEQSLVFFSGTYSHTAPKEPFRHGLSPTYPSRAVYSSKAEVRFCKSALLQLPTMPTYARVDIFEHKSEFMLNEMELIEPELHFHLKKNSEKQLASALLALCRNDARRVRIE